MIKSHMLMVYGDCNLSLHSAHASRNIGSVHLMLFVLHYF